MMTAVYIILMLLQLGGFVDEKKNYYTMWVGKEVTVLI